MSSPQPSSHESGLVFPAVAARRGCRQGLLGGFGRRGRGLHRATAAVLLFRNLAACLCSPFLILSLPPAPWGVLLSPPIFIKVSLQFQSGRLFFPHPRLLRSLLGGNCNFCNGSVGDLARRQGPVTSGGLIVCLPAAWHDYKSFVEACGDRVAGPVK